MDTDGEAMGGAIVWDDVCGIRDLNDALAVEIGLDLKGWLLTAALSVSDDGTTGTIT